MRPLRSLRTLGSLRTRGSGRAFESERHVEELETDRDVVVAPVVPRAGAVIRGGPQHAIELGGAVPVVVAGVALVDDDAMIAVRRVGRQARDDERVVDAQDVQLDRPEHDGRVLVPVESVAEDVQLPGLPQGIHIGDLDAARNTLEARSGCGQSCRAEDDRKRVAQGALPHWSLPVPDFLLLRPEQCLPACSPVAIDGGEV
jgi:hypothetical protein